MSATEIGLELGIPRSTVSAWLGLDEQSKHHGSDHGCMRCGDSAPVAFPGLRDWSYVYLLGQYLGDGYLGMHPKGVLRLEIFAFSGHRRLIGETAAAMEIVMPASRVAATDSKRNRCTTIGSYSKHWPHLFPQHGPGRKHLRSIELATWQRELCERHPGRLLRGLIHSDGCRSMNIIRHPKKTYSYPRYEFSNRSDDIRGIFCTYCDQLGIEWRQMNRWTISVARRDSVAELDRLVGPKR